MINIQNLLLLNLIKDFDFLGCEFVKNAMLQKNYFIKTKKVLLFLVLIGSL